jgi:type IV secretion system protein VirB10
MAGKDAAQVSGPFFRHNSYGFRRAKMTSRRLTLTAFFLAGSMVSVAPRLAAAQDAPPPAPTAPPAADQPAAPPPPAAAPAPVATIINVPAGTKVLLETRSAVNTKSAKPGDGVYLYSTFPVVVGNRVVIPSGVYVQGVVDSVVRPGRGLGAQKAQLNMHFTSMIFPNGSVVEIPGVVNGLPGAEHQKVNGDEGTIQQEGGSNKAHNAGETAKVAVPTGATIGSIGGLQAGHPLAGGLEGAGAGLAAAGIVALFTRGADVNIPSGTQVEMVLQRPLQVQEANINGPTSLVPASSASSRCPSPAASASSALPAVSAAASAARLHAPAGAIFLRRSSQPPRFFIFVETESRRNS